MALFSDDEDYQDDQGQNQQPLNTLDHIDSSRNLYNNIKNKQGSSAAGSAGSQAAAKGSATDASGKATTAAQGTAQEAGKKTVETAGGTAEKSSLAAGAFSGNAATAAASAASIPILIIIAIVIGIILLIFFLIGVLADLTSFSTFDTATSYIDESKKKGIDDIKSFLGKFSQLFDNTEWIEADENEYDPDNEFDVGYITTYNLINTMLNKAYSKEVDDLVEQYCNENGLNSALTKQKLDEKYPNKWKDVYENVNYAELINILGLGKYSGKYTDYESMKSFLFEEDNWSYFYNIKAETQESETEGAETKNSNDSSTMQKSKSKYAVVTIVPYCKSDLFEMLGINKDDICEDNMTYYERLDAMMMQANANCSGRNGEPRTIYYTLNMDKPLAEWEQSFSSISANDILADNTTSITGGDNPETIWKMLKAAGFTDEGAAGVMGNLQAENGFRTNVTAGDQGSIGLCQWRLGRADALRSFAASHNLPVDGIQAQGGYLIYEFPAQTGKHYDSIKNATDTIAACDLVAKYFERCAYAASYDIWQQKYSRYAWSRFKWSNTCNVYIIDLDKRESYASLYYSKYAGME